MVWAADGVTVVETETGKETLSEFVKTLEGGRTFLDMNRKDILLIVDTLKKAVVSGLCDDWEDVEDIGFIIQQLTYLFEEWNSDHIREIMDPVVEDQPKDE